MRKTFKRAVAFLLMMMLMVSSFGIEAFAGGGCSVKSAKHHVGWYTMSNANSDESACWGINSPRSFYMGHACTGVPTHTLKVNGVWKQAYCLDAPRGTENGCTYSCVNNVDNMDAKAQAVLATILYRTETLGGITIDSDGDIPRCGGTTQTDHWLVCQILTWAFRGGNVFFQGNGRIGVSEKARADLDEIINKMKTKHRPNDAKALRTYVDNMYNQIDWMYRIPSFAVYTSTHPMGKQIEGHAGKGSHDGTIILDKTCKQPDGTYKKVLHDDNGVLGAFDFTSQFGVGVTGVQIEQDKSKGTLTITYDPAWGDGCPIDWKGTEVTRDLPTGANSVVFWQCGGYQRFSTYVPSKSKLGCKINLQVKDCGETPPPDQPSVSVPVTSAPTSETPGIPTGTPTTVVKTPETYLRKTSDDGNVAGIVFTITGNGETYHKTTNESGFIDISDLPQYIPGTQQLVEYHVEEEIPVEYIHDKDNASKNFVLEPGKTQYLEFANKRKMWRLTFKKHDVNLATQAQGKGSLAGAVFAVYKDGELLDMYVTDENGSITTKYYPCGPGYTLTEMTPPTGYMSDATVYRIGLMPGETLEQYNDCNRLEPLDGDDPDVIRKVYSTQSALEYRETTAAFEAEH